MTLRSAIDTGLRRHLSQTLLVLKYSEIYHFSLRADSLYFISVSFKFIFQRANSLNFTLVSLFLELPSPHLSIYSSFVVSF